jgi:hypothetical protein
MPVGLLIRQVQFHDRGELCLCQAALSVRIPVIINKTVKSRCWVRLDDALRRNSRYGRKIVRLVRRIQMDGRLSVALLRSLLSEIYSLAHRMALQWRRCRNPYIVIVGPLLERTTTGDLRMNTRTHACRSDIESFAASRRWATTIDLEIYRDAWVKGSEWGENNSRMIERESFPRMSNPSTPV